MPSLVQKAKVARRAKSRKSESSRAKQAGFHSERIYSRKAGGKKLGGGAAETAESLKETF